jgi:hypothetical protein
VGSASPSTINFNGASNEFETFNHHRPHCADHIPCLRQNGAPRDQPARVQSWAWGLAISRSAVDSTQRAGGARPAKTERTKRRRLLSIEVRREVENNTGLGEAGAIDPTSKATIRGGKTYEEAIKHAEETLTLYLESYDELGKSIPEERGLKQPTSPG